MNLVIVLKNWYLEGFAEKGYTHYLAGYVHPFSFLFLFYPSVEKPLTLSPHLIANSFTYTFLLFNPKHFSNNLPKSVGQIKTSSSYGTGNGSPIFHIGFKWTCCCWKLHFLKGPCTREEGEFADGLKYHRTEQMKRLTFSTLAPKENRSTEPCFHLGAGALALLGMPQSTLSAHWQRRWKFAWKGLICVCVGGQQWLCGVDRLCWNKCSTGKIFPVRNAAESQFWRLAARSLMCTRGGISNF